MGNLYRTGGGNKKIDPAIDATKVACVRQYDGKDTTVTITATKNMKKALLVAAASFGIYDGNSSDPVDITIPVSVTSNKALTPLPNANNNAYMQFLNGSKYASISSACQLYIVNDVAKGDYFTLQQFAYSGAYYKSLTLISLD